MADTNLALAVGLPLVASVAVYVWAAASLSAVFGKAGEPGWQAWVPVLNIVVLLRLGRFSPWWALLLLVPIIGTAALAVIIWIACHRINAEFGVGIGMTVLAVVLLPVWSSILGWGSARWLGTDRDVSGPRRADTDADLDARFGAPAYAGGTPPYPAWPDQSPAPLPGTALAFAAAGEPRRDTPPRPASVPPAPPAGWDAAPTAPTAPGLSAASPFVARAPSMDPFADDAVAPAPRWRPIAVASEVPGHRIADDDSEPYEVPAGPRRAVPPDTGADHHLLVTRDEAPGAAPSPAPIPARDPWAPPFDEAAAVHSARSAPVPDHGFFDTSAEVSAVAAAPALGAPMSARSSVSAMRDEPELPEAENAFDETIVAARRRTAWMLHPPLGAAIAVSSDVVIIGRRPSSDPSFPHAQLVPVADETRTISKTHARLELRDDAWTIVDLDSTNGVVLVRPDGTEVELLSGRPTTATESFLLGDAELRLTHTPGVE